MSLIWIIFSEFKSAELRKNLQYKPLLKNLCTSEAYSPFHFRIRALDMTCNMNKIFNTRKDEEDEPPNAPGIHIGPVAKEARDKAAKEFNEGIKEITHMTISKYSAQNLNIPL